LSFSNSRKGHHPVLISLTGNAAQWGSILSLIVWKRKTLFYLNTVDSVLSQIHRMEEPPKDAGRMKRIKMKSQQTHLQFSFLPYITLKDELKIGDILLWPFYKKKDIYLRQETIRIQIQRLLAQYVENSKELKPLPNITILSYRSPDYLNPLTDKQLTEIRNAVTLLCFCTIIRNKSFYAFSSDDFQLFRQNFIPGDDGVAPSSGSIITRKYGGPKIDEILFIRPLRMSSGQAIIFDEEILRSLEKLQQDQQNQQLSRRIMSALEWVGYAYANTDNFNYFSRIVMMATAFEILLGGFRNRWEFIKKIKKYTCNPGDNNPRDREKRTIKNRKGFEAREYSFKEWWAYEFYGLRNRIVHGDEIGKRDIRNRKGNEYFFLSLEFFEECLKRILGQNNYYQYDPRNQIIWAGIHRKI